MPPAEVPSDLMTALAAEPAAAKAFYGMPLSHQREYAKYIGEAKKAATRERRITWTIERLLGSAQPKRAHGQA